MSADKRLKGRRRRSSSPVLVSDAVGEPSDAPSARRGDGERARGVRGATLAAASVAASVTGDPAPTHETAYHVALTLAAAPTPAQRATELARAAHALAAHEQTATTNVGDSVTFATREAPEIPVAPVTSGATAGDVTDDMTTDVTEEARVTLNQEQRDGAVADELAPDERPTLLGLPLMAGSLSGSSNPDPQSGPETTRRAARPPRPTRPVQPYEAAPAVNGAIIGAVHGAVSAPPPSSTHEPTPGDAAEEPTAPRQAASPHPAAPDAFPAQPATPTPAEPPDTPVGASNDDSRDAAALTDGDTPTITPAEIEAPDGSEPLAMLTPLVTRGGIAPTALAEAALADGASTPDDDPNAAHDANAAAVVDVSAVSAPQDHARLQAIDLSQQALGPIATDQALTRASANSAASAPPDAALATGAQPPAWPDLSGRTPTPANAPNLPYAPPGNPLPTPPMPTAAPGAPLAPLGAQFGAPPPGYQSPYPPPGAGAPAPGQPGPGQGEANAQLPTHAPWAVAASWGESSLSGPNTAAGMSYLFWWLSGIFVYFNERQNRFVRFHAMQSILLTGALTMISVLLFTILQLFDDAAAAAHQPAIAHIGLGIVIIGYALGVLAPWFAAMVAAWSGTYLRIPFIGDYAERFAAPPREVYPDSPPY